MADHVIFQQAEHFLAGASIPYGHTRQGTPFHPHQQLAFSRTNTMAATLQDAGMYLQGFDDSASRTTSALSNEHSCGRKTFSDEHSCGRKAFHEQAHPAFSRTNTMAATLQDAGMYLQGFDGAARRSSFGPPATPPSPGVDDNVISGMWAWDGSADTASSPAWDMTMRQRQARMDDSPARNLRSSPPRQSRPWLYHY